MADQGLFSEPDAPPPYGGVPTKRHRLNMLAVIGGFLAGFVAVSLRLAFLQLDPHQKLSEEELFHIGTIDVRVPRGEIQDCKGRLLAKDQQVYSLWADPRAVADPDMATACLGAKLGLSEEELRPRLAKRDAVETVRKFTWIKRWMNEANVEAFRQLDPMLQSGLALKKESIRFYPEGDLAAHVLGFVNREGIGCEGVEASYDKYLRSVAGTQKSRVDAHRNFLASLTFESVEPQGGGTVCLTIDKTIQRTLEQEIDRALGESCAPRGMGIVVDPSTGAILALACRPAYDPNEYWKTEPAVYKNRAVLDVFEPGSSFKIVTASAALEHGLITPNTMIDCEGGAFNPYGHRITDFHKLGVEPFTRCFSESSNIATIKVAAMLGPERLESWLRRFKFGCRTSPDFQVESPGILHPRSEWSKLTMGAIPIGQEIALTMPQLARAFCVIANGGFLIEPYLVDRVLDRDGKVVYEHVFKERERILSAGTAKTMKELCHLVVLHGTGKPAGIPEFRVGGKTGTAQIARPDGKGFYADKYTAIFAGFAPVGNPRLCAAIVIQEPGIKLHFGGSISGPVFKAVIRDALIGMSCPQDPVTDNGEGGVQPVEEADTDTVVARPVSPRDGVADESEDPLDKMALDGLELVSLKPPASPDEPVLPDFTGMTKRQAKARIDALGVAWDTQGAGRVIAQDPPPGTPLRDMSLCRLAFSNKPVESPHEPAPTSRDTRVPTRPGA